MKSRRDDGFTIIELLIATTVLSVILLLVTTMMIGMGNLFYKGINQSRVQDGVRGTLDEITQQLQLSDVHPAQGTDSANSDEQVYCLGNTRYSFVYDVQIGSRYNGRNYHHILWRDTKPGCDPTKGVKLTIDDPDRVGARNAGTDGAELIAPNSRLASFCVGTATTDKNSCSQTLTSPFTVSVGMAYGDDSTLCDAGTTSPLDDCSQTTTSTHLVNPAGQILCKTQIGDQFCATSYLSTTVANRL